MDSQSSMDDQFLDKIYKSIEENLDNEYFSVEDLAKHAGLSRSMLHRKLIRLAGKSASDLISEKRLIRAKEMLENNVATASEIAYKVGFNSPSYFNKAFKKYFHVLPGDVRKGTAVFPHQLPSGRYNEIPDIISRNNRNVISAVLIVFIILCIAGATIYYILKKDKPVEKSIAILPFDNLSTDLENQYFADGIVEDLLYRISQIEGLKVISRTSSEMFRDKGSKTIPEIADLLHVSYILEGTVQRETDNIRINVQLIDAKRDDHILSKRYDRNLSEIFNIQSEIAGQIASELSIILTDQQAILLKQNQTTNLKAFEYKLLGRYHLNKRTREDLFTSVKYFRLAIEEDPHYALAYAELADSYYILSYHDFIERKIGRDSALYFALKALQLDNNLGEAHNVLGGIYFTYDWKFQAAKEEYLKALMLKPNHPSSYQYYSELLCTTGKLREARELINKAIRLDPYSYIIHLASSILYYKEENYRMALAENQICQDLVKDNYKAIFYAFYIYIKLKNEPAALENFKKVGEITGKWTPEEVDSIYRIEGIDGLLRWKLNEWEWNREYYKAADYARLGEDEKALEILESAVNNGTLDPFQTSDLAFKNLRSNPRFIAIRNKMGLPPL